MFRFIVLVLLSMYIVCDCLSVGSTKISACRKSPTALRDHDDDADYSQPRREMINRGVGCISSCIGASFLINPCTASAGDFEGEKKKLTFTTLEDGVTWADIREGNSDKLVDPTSKVNIHLTGRLLGKNGWIFENSQQDNEPYRLQLGFGRVISGLEDGLQGMREGGTRRIVIPSNAGFLDKTLEPIPRDFGNRQRLYTTVMNSVRVDRERAALGSDLAGKVVIDVELLRIR